jgi:glycosyltransferase involved in cell wall biosynthesis
VNHEQVLAQHALRDQKIVILLAAFNGAAHITEQLESFVAQSHSNWELLVSDDGSTDETIDLIRRFASSIPQKVSLIEGPRRGFWQNFLSLLRQADQADGDLFAFSDQDDIWLPEKLERATKWFGKIEQDVPSLYFTRTELIDQAGRRIGYSPLFGRNPSFQNALVQNIGGGNTMVMNKPAIALLARTPESVQLIAHDWWTYQVVTASGGRAFYDSVPSVRYRQHPNNLIGSNRGVRPRVMRTLAFASGRWKYWNDVSFKALQAVRSSFSPSSRASFDDFSLARQSGLSDRIRLLWRSGVYRQNAAETIAMYIGAIFGRI